VRQQGAVAGGALRANRGLTTGGRDWEESNGVAGWPTEGGCGGRGWAGPGK